MLGDSIMGKNMYGVFTLMEIGSGKEISMKGNTRMGKNMVKEHTLGLMELSM